MGQVGGNHMAHATKDARAANDSEKLKHTKYDEDARQHNMEVCPMGFEVQGKWGQSTHEVFHLITTRMNNVNNASLLPKALSTSYWKQKIAIIHKYLNMYYMQFMTNPLEVIKVHLVLKIPIIMTCTQIHKRVYEILYKILKIYLFVISVFFLTQFIKNSPIQ